MFTGIIEQVGVLAGRSGSGGKCKLTIRPRTMFADLRVGESIAVNGCCLSLEDFDRGQLTFHTLDETLRRTNLSELEPGAQVNLERALRLGDRLGGHMVSGHVDAQVRLISLKEQGPDVVLVAELPPELAGLVVLKGSVAVDGVSLTVAELTPGSFGVHLIPLTLRDTALGSRRTGDCVNLECDMVGRYLLRKSELAGEAAASKPAITMDTLRDAGFL